MFLIESQPTRAQRFVSISFIYLPFLINAIKGSLMLEDHNKIQIKDVSFNNHKHNLGCQSNYQPRTAWLKATELGAFMQA